MKFVITDTTLRSLFTYYLILGITSGQKITHETVCEALKRMKPACEERGLPAYALLVKSLPELTEGLSESYLEDILERPDLEENIKNVNLDELTRNLKELGADMYEYPEALPLRDMLKSLLETYKEEKKA